MNTSASRSVAKTVGDVNFSALQLRRLQRRRTACFVHSPRVAPTNRNSTDLAWNKRYQHFPFNAACCFKGPVLLLALRNILFYLHETK